jgi:predicted dehydrogenase
VIRLGYVGCGFVAQHIHLPNFASLEGCRLAALAELRPELGRRVAERHNIPAVYRSHTELSEDASIDAVAISAAHDVQGDIAADLLLAGKHVFLEKPMAVSLVQANRILTAARSGGSRLMVAYMKRHDPGNDLARQIIADWRLTSARGRTIYARSHGFGGNWTAGLDTSAQISTNEVLPQRVGYHNLPVWLPAEWGERYVEYLQQYSHNINLLRFLLGAGDDARVRSVHLDDDGYTGVVILDVAGVRTVIESGVIEFHQWDWHTQVYFDQGWIKVHAPPFFLRPSQARVEIYEGGRDPAYRYPIAQPLTAWPYREEAAAFIDALERDAPFRSPGEDTLTDVRICEEIFQHALADNGTIPSPVVRRR